MKLFIILLLFFITSCGRNAFLSEGEISDTSPLVAVPRDDSNDDSNDASNDDSSDDSGDDSSDDYDDDSGDDFNIKLCSKSNAEVLNTLSGDYSSGCVSHINGHSIKTDLSIATDGSYKLVYELFKGKNCKSSEAKIEYKLILMPEGCLNNHSELIKVNFQSLTTLFAPISNQYTKYLNKINECSFSKWKKNESKDVSGLTCGFLLSTDPHHDTYRSVYDSHYSVIKLKDNEIFLPDWTVNSGDSEAERIDSVKSTQEFILKKLNL